MADNIQRSECVAMREKIQEKAGQHQEQLSEIKGGIRVLIYMLGIIGALVVAICVLANTFLNFRLSSIEARLQGNSQPIKIATHP